MGITKRTSEETHIYWSPSWLPFRRKWKREYFSLYLLSSDLAKVDKSAAISGLERTLRQELCIHICREFYCLSGHIGMHARIQILLLVKGLLKEFRIFSAIIINDMRVYIGDHIDLGMTGVSLYRLDVTAI